MSIFSPKIITAIQVAQGLIKAGIEIFNLLNGKEDLTDAELQAIIDKQNAAQAKARDELNELLK